MLGSAWKRKMPRICSACAAPVNGNVYFRLVLFLTLLIHVSAQIQNGGVSNGARTQIQNGGLSSGARTQIQNGDLSNGARTQIQNGGLSNGARTQIQNGGLSNGARTQIQNGGLSNGARTQIQNGGLSNGARTQIQNGGMGTGSRRLRPGMLRGSLRRAMTERGLGAALSGALGPGTRGAMPRGQPPTPRGSGTPIQPAITGSRPSSRRMNTRAGLMQIPLARRQDVIRQRLRDLPRVAQGQRTGIIDPRTGSVVQPPGETPTRLRLPPQTARITGQGSRGNLNPPLFTMCVRPRSVRCFPWPANQDAVNAYRCDGACTGEACVVACQCSCVDPTIIGRLRRIGRISGRELRPIDPRLWQSFDPLRTSRGRPAIATRPSNRLPMSRRDRTPPDMTMMQRNNTASSAAINFGISDDVLATLIAQPDLNILVGPQGINQIIAGEPPVILAPEAPPRAEMRQQPPPVNASVRQEPVPTRIKSARTAVQSLGMGIPVPMNRINLVPLSDPSSPLATGSDMTSGLNIDLPAPSPVVVPGTTVERAVTVEKIPGTRALFIDLTLRGNPTPGGNRNSLQLTRAVAQVTRTRDQLQGQSVDIPPVVETRARNTTRNSLRSSNMSSTDLGGSLTLSQTQPRTVIDSDPTRGALGRAPTKDECLSRLKELWCDPQGPWDVTPGVARWCLLNCRSDNCDNTRCSCECIDEAVFRIRYEQISLRAP